MKYNLYFSTEPLEDDGWETSSEDLDRWFGESVVPQVGDGVFMKKGGWRTVKHVGFSTIGNSGIKKQDRKKRRLVLISVSRN